MSRTDHKLLNCIREQDPLKQGLKLHRDHLETPSLDVFVSKIH